jgi:hypothetical protein
MNPAASISIAALVGLLSGTHASIWGMYKDAVHEGFALGRFCRSMIVGALCAILIETWLRLPMDDAGTLVLLFGLSYAAERGIVEVWKTFVRHEDQAKYFIPMQFSIRGRPVEHRGIRLAAGAAYVVVVALCLGAIGLLDRAGPPRLTTILLVGLVVGLIVAVGGGWKDAPKEGFDLVKFFRSPMMTVVWALILSRLTDSALLSAVGAIGFERATAETYKTFFFPSRPRGKFSGKPVTHPEMLRRRIYFVPVYLTIWVLVVALGALALRVPAARLAGAGL